MRGKEISTPLEMHCSREKAYLHLIGERSDGLRAERSSGYAR